MYDFACECGWADELICSVATRDEQVCPTCGAALLRRCVYAMQPVGALWDKKIDLSKQIGRTFSTNEELRQYKRDNPGVEVVSKNDSILTRGRDRRLESVEQKAMKAGWRNAEHRRQWAKSRHKKLTKEGIAKHRE